MWLVYRVHEFIYIVGEIDIRHWILFSSDFCLECFIYVMLHLCIEDQLYFGLITGHPSDDSNGAFNCQALIDIRGH